MRRQILYAVMLLVAMTLTPAVARAQATDDLNKAPRITLAEFKKLLADDRVFVIDVRAYSTYLLGHIPGARSYPLEDLGLKVDELKAIKKPIVAYCA